MKTKDFLVRDVGIVIAVKLAILTLIYFAFFSGSQGPPIDGASVSRNLFALHLSSDGASR